ncbi:MAG TPA: DUF3761 domain-containing protein [Burkholderiaceae bacterium]|nr:DUF3761 domain-containing protein [Burkholderiaceae bacterium]
MRTLLSPALAAGLLVSFSCFAAAPADAPAGSTGLCKDGTYYSGAEKKGACSGHKGVKEWWGAASTAATDTKAAPGAAAPVAPAPAAAAPAAPAKTTTASTAKPAGTAAPGGGPGLVWANTSSKVYHCQGDKWYGKTKAGEYMSEADAKTKGFKPDHGKACSS